MSKKQKEKLEKKIEKETKKDIKKNYKIGIEYYEKVEDKTEWKLEKCRTKIIDKLNKIWYKRTSKKILLVLLFLCQIKFNA